MGVSSLDGIYMLLRSGRRKEALRALYNASSWRLRHPFAKDPNHVWYVVGTALFDEGKFDLARLAFKRSLKTRLDDWQAFWALGNCYSELGRPKLAERYFAKALRFRKKGSTPYLTYNLANALYDQGKLPEAIRMYRRIIGSRNNAVVGLAKKNLALAKAQLPPARE